MRLRINQLAVELDYTEADIVRLVAHILACKERDLRNVDILRRSLDARRKDRAPRYVLSAEVDFTGDSKPPLAPGRVELAPERPAPLRVPVQPAPPRVPVVVGAGPAGLMAALTLAQAGQKPLLIDRGARTDRRSAQVEDFWHDGILDTECNVLYGEGGAGLFSDGKLTSRSKDKGAIRHLFETFVDLGASSDILIDAEPHLGSDLLTELVPTLRKRIEDLGGAVSFDSKLESLQIEGGVLRGVSVAGREIETDACFLATGHSARDVYEMLATAGVPLEAKPFAVGIRLETPQHWINWSQYGKWSAHPLLGSASFRLTRKPGTKTRSCYSFCMCPGGLVIACASSEGRLTTNGMSYSGRAKYLGNAAFLVPVRPDDFPETEGPAALAGTEFQENLERAAFQAGGGDYSLPAQRLDDFLSGRFPGSIPEERSCDRAVPVDLRALLPDFVQETLLASLPPMLRQLKGVQEEDVLAYGLETRSSSPVRVLRDASSLESMGVRGLFPIGEGSGYAGGIVSSALDGLHAALRFLGSSEATG